MHSLRPSSLRLGAVTVMRASLKYLSQESWGMMPRVTVLIRSPWHRTVWSLSGNQWVRNWRVIGIRCGVDSVLEAKPWKGNTSVPSVS
eukprot:1277882-Rhodomonas_salina.1